MIKKLNNKGSLLLMTYYVISSMVIIGAAFVVLMVNDQRTSIRHQLNIKAQAIAEAGFEKAIYHLTNDYNNNHSFQDGQIDGMPFAPNSVDFVELIPSTVFGDGSYVVSVKNVAGSDREIWVKASGTIRDNTQVIEAYIKMINTSVWSNAVMVGSGASGRGFKGNADIRGSVHILGTALLNTDKAISLSSSSLIGNNYDGLSGVFLSKIEASPNTTYNNETVATLFAQLRAKAGLVELGGLASIGQNDTPLNAFKETLDGFYSNDGLTGSQMSAVYADNGSNNAYDLTGVVFPSLNDPYPSYANFQDYLYNNALIINDPADIALLSNLLPSTVFAKSNAKGSLVCDGAGNMTIDGIIYIDSGTLNLNKDGGNSTFNYSGKGVVFATGDIGINANLLVATNASFPSTNLMVFMTPGHIVFNESGIEVMGLFYGENQISINQPASIVGTVVSNSIDSQTSNPTIVQVPATVNYLPVGTIAATQHWSPTVISWKKD